MIKNKLIDAQDVNSMAAETSEYNGNDEIEIGLPIYALILDLLPVLIVFLDRYAGGRLPAFVFLVAVLAPIAGLTAGIVSLSKGKARIGLVGLILAIVAIALPLSIIGIIVLFFIGVHTGSIQMGM
ncbi:MAG: hypothetical protein LBP22_00635 [Deltaproteobacteria bacterium]|jgi:hypothetical protein|nr:hypothetical protein [Deltaproteobacteria bacterium]